MMSQLHLSDIRTDYKKATLNKKEVAGNPISQFEKWFEEALHSEVEEPNAMTLATTTLDNIPSARIVLLKGIDNKGFYFYTNYKSRKGKELLQNPHAALVFFWKPLERQVRIQGCVEKTSKQQSDQYYSSRPRGSQIGAWASHQSMPIASRERLEDKVAQVKEKFNHEPIIRPPFWGGFCLKPQAIEFWQGRPNRLHDRIEYTLNSEGEWEIKRLSP